MKKLITSLTFGLLVASFGCSYQPNRIPQPRQDRSQTSTKTRRVTTGTSTTTSRHTKGRDSLATDSILPPGSKPIGAKRPTDSLPPTQRRDSLSEELIFGDTTLLELPRRAGGAHNYFITHHASGVVNYSLEYDVHKLHARWGRLLL